MPEITLAVKNQVGLHARPASLFVRTAGKYTSDITVTHGDRSTNAQKAFLAFSHWVSIRVQRTLLPYEMMQTR